METRFSDVEERLRGNDEEGETALLREEFGSECDTAIPDHHEVSGADEPLPSAQE